MKYALITGGTRGIGLATARLFDENGYRVTACYGSDEESAAEARKMLPNVNFVRADVSREEEVKALCGALPALDVLVLNAGISSFSQVQDVEEGTYDRTMDVNMKGTFLFSKHAVKKLLERRGAIVGITSVWGETGASCESVYSASKGAMVAFLKSLAKELAPSGVRVNAVSPGVIDTQMNARLAKEERKSLADEIPLGRFGTADEVASAVYFLATHPYITGEVLRVNGGFLI